MLLGAWEMKSGRTLGLQSGVLASTARFPERHKDLFLAFSVSEHCAVQGDETVGGAQVCM